MKGFADRIQISNEQKKEVMRYLNSFTVLSEDSILKIVRKMKQLEVKLNENKYSR